MRFWLQRLISVVLASVSMASADAVGAQAGPWHLVSSFGHGGVAGVSVRERLQEEGSQGALPPPERDRGLIAPGPQGSVFVGGYARSKPGAFLLTRMTQTGALDKGFAHGGEMVVPTVRWFKTDPPRPIALPSGKLLVVGLDKADQLAAVRVTASGRLDRDYGRGGVAEHTLQGAHEFTIITAAVVQPDGELLVAYQKELPQPVNQPRVPEGQGNGSIHYVRLSSSGGLDPTFGKGGFLTAQHPEVSLLEGESGTVGACAETLSSSGSLLIAYEGFALEEFSPTGELAKSFGSDPTPPLNKGAMPLPDETKNGFHFCDGLFALPSGDVEGVEGKRLTRLNPSGTPDPTFGTSGVSAVTAPVTAAGVASSGETFSAGESGKRLVVAGILANGQPDSTLGGAKGQLFGVELPAPRDPGGGEGPTWEVLPTPNSITVRVGEKLIRVSK